MTELPAPSTMLSQCDTLPPVAILDRAYAEARELVIHDRIRNGDIIKIAQRHGLDCKGYATLRQRVLRYSHGNATQNNARANKRKSESPVDVHGRLFYSTLVLNDSLLQKLPWHGTTRGWRGLVTPEVTVMAFKNGRLDCYPKVPDWRGRLRALLEPLWGAQAVDAVLACLKANGSKLEVAIAAPGIELGQSQVFKNGLVEVTTDQTPRTNGNVEVKIDIGHIDTRLDAIEKSIESIPNSLKAYLGSITVMQILTQMQAEIAQLRMAMYSGAPAGCLPEGSNASNGAPPPIAGSNPAGSGPAVQGILKPGVVYRRCPHLSQEGTMMRCEKTRPRLHVGDIEGYPANPVIIPKEEFFRNEKFVCRADFRSCPYFQGRSG